MTDTELVSKSESISFKSDDFTLKGNLHMPQNVSRPPVIIGSHGFSSNKESPKQIALAKACNEHGMAYFRFDHRGCGESEGNFNEVTSLEGRCHDLASALSTIHNMDATGNRIGLFGSSFGGATALVVAKKMKVDAIVTFAAPVDSAPVIKALENSEDDVSASLESMDTEKLQFDITDIITGICNILIIHGDSDKVVSPSNAYRIYQQAVHPKRIIMQRAGDHRMSLKENQDKFLKNAIDWYRSFLLN